MAEENSYGIIPLRKKEKQWEIFMVQHRKGHWTFPKGHPEEGESPIACAERELLEETGLIVKELLSFHSLKEEYQFQRNNRSVKKHNEYFFAIVEGDVNLQKEELLDGKWVLLVKAKEIATFPESKRLCLQIESTLRK